MKTYPKYLIESPVYLKILVAIIHKHHTGSDIARDVGKSQATCQKQLKYMVTQGYVVEKMGKKYNERLFFINQKNVSGDLIKILTKETKILKALKKIFVQFGFQDTYFMLTKIRREIME